MYDIFISYAREDKPKAEAIARVFGEEGWSVWWDHAILPGERFEELIITNLETAKCVIVLWSGHSVTSDWVKDEASKGKERKILIPVLLEDIRQPFGFGQIQAANLANWDGTASDTQLEFVLNAVARNLNRPREKGKKAIAENPDTEKKPDREKKLVQEKKRLTEKKRVTEIERVTEKEWSAKLLKKGKRERIVQISLTHRTFMITFQSPFFDYFSPFIVKVDDEIVYNDASGYPTQLDFQLNDGAVTRATKIESRMEGINVIADFRISVSDQLLYSDSP